MPTPAKNTYVITPLDGSAPYEVQATSYEFVDSTGRHLLKDGEELVATLVNVNVLKKPS